MRKALLALPLLASLALSGGEPAKVGAAAPAFSLPSAAGGAPVALKDLVAKNKATVVIFIATKCPYSNGYNERMAKLGRDLPAQGIALVGINSNKSESASDVAEHARKHQFTFPVLKDEGNKVADLYNAQHTPEVFVIDSNGTLVYHGRIDETYDEPKNVKSPDLQNALTALLSGKPVPAAETKAFGCSIKRV
ncbi:MAG: thioredoxin family protein [Thermoanaerobaculia bacterium]